MNLRVPIKRSFGKAQQPDTAGQVLRLLRKLYPDPSSELHFVNDYQLLVCVMLSAQCTDKKVNEVTPALFARYRNFGELGGAKLSALQKIIRPINYYRTKSSNLISSAKRVAGEFGGRVPLDREALISLPGVGNKTANVVLGELGAACTFPVDTHVFRVSRRLGLAQGRNVESVEEDLKKLFKPKDWRTMHHCFILHGRRVCKARRPLCAQCVLNELCPSAQRGES